MAVLGVIHNIQNPYLGLEKGRRYWEGGGIGRGGIEGGKCSQKRVQLRFLSCMS